MKKTFRQLETGDSLYIVNTGTACGGIRIEEYKVKKPIYHNEKIKEWWTLETEGLPWPHQFLESQLDDTSCAFIFTDLIDAKKYYLEHYQEVVDPISKELDEIDKKHHKLWNMRAYILQHASEMKYQMEHMEEYQSWLDSGMDCYQPTKMY